MRGVGAKMLMNEVSKIDEHYINVNKKITNKCIFLLLLEFGKIIV